MPINPKVIDHIARVIERGGVVEVKKIKDQIVVVEITRTATKY